MTDRVPMQMVDPVFVPNSQHTATASLIVSPTGIACIAELWLTKDGGATKAATSGDVGFNSTGATQAIVLPVTMPPDAGFSYAVCLDIKSGGELIGAYYATESVLIPLVGTPVITWQ